MLNKIKELGITFFYSIIITAVLSIGVFYGVQFLILGKTTEEANELLKEGIFYLKRDTVGTDEEFYQNEKINQLINKQDFQLSRNFEPVVCLLDSDNDGHFQKTKNELERFFKGDIRYYAQKVFGADFTEEISDVLLECDIINLSMGLKVTSDPETFQYHKDNYRIFLEKWDGMFVASSGNSDNIDTRFEQTLVQVREENPEFKDRIVIVGQLHNDSGVLVNEDTLGEAIDVMVPNGSYIKPHGNQFYDSKGTSYAAPAVTGVLANLMSHYGNKDQADLKKRLLLHTATFTETLGDQRFTYPLLNVGSAYGIEEPI